MMPESDDEKFRQLLGYFFCEMANPHSTIKVRSQILEMYLMVLKEHEIPPVVLPSGEMMPEHAYEILQCILKGIQSYEQVTHRFRQGSYESYDDYQSAMMSENINDDNCRTRIGFFLNEVNASFTAIKGFSQMLEMYLAGLKEHEIPAVVHKFSPDGMTSELAHMMIQGVLEKLPRYEEIKREIGQELERPNDEMEE